MAYIGAEPDGQGKAQRFTYTSASGGETTITADDDGIPIGYTAGQVSVYLNGVKLVVGTGKDCQATNGSTITGLAALAASDVVEVVALSTFDATTVEGTAIISTGESGGSKFLREDGDGTSSWQTVTEYNDDVIQTNIALLGFKVAVNGSLAKYDLQDQIVDEYETEAGVNTGDSTNQSYTSGEYYSATLGGGGSGGSSIVIEPAAYNGVYRSHTFINNSGNTLVFAETQLCDVFIAGGGGAGGHGGGGAGAFRAWTGMSFPAGTYTATIGAGGTADTDADMSGGNTTLSYSGGGSFTTLTAEGGGHGAEDTAQPAESGGSGGGGKEKGGGGPIAGGSGNSGGDTAAVNSGTVVTPAVSGYAGGSSPDADWLGSSGGGGASAVGQDGQTGNNAGASGPGGDGGAFRTNYFRDGNTSGTTSAFHRFCGGGGGIGYLVTNPNPGGTDNGVGGGAGAGAGIQGGTGVAATDNTGSGGGGGSVSDNKGGNGGSGIVVIRYIQPPDDLTLQSSDTTAETAPTKADMVILVEDAGSGVASLDTSSGNIKGWVSMYEAGDGTKTWTQVPLVDEGHWGVGPSSTGKRILAAHDVTLTGTSGTQMAYKITTHSASAVYNTRIHATSIGWR